MTHKYNTRHHVLTSYSRISEHKTEQFIHTTINLMLQTFAVRYYANGITDISRTTSQAI